MSDIVDWGRKHRANREHKRDQKAQRRSSGPGARASAQPVPESRGQLAPLDLSSDLIVVSVACWRTPAAMLERAVRSVLDGEHKNVRVVVISDGEETPSWRELSSEILHDPRLVLVQSPRNAGPYFNHDVVLRAAAKIGAPLFAVQDSDDESHPQRFTRLLHTMHASRCESVHAHLSQVEGGQRRFVTGSAAAGEGWSHRANHFGLYGVGTLMALGGYYAGFRVGYDTNLTSFLNLLTRTQMAPGALYTRYQRNNSLTRAPSTGHGSALRKAHRATLRAMWEGAVRKARISRAEAVKYIRETAVRRGHASGLSGIRNALVEEIVGKLSVAGVESVPPVHPALLQRAVDGVEGMSSWAITRKLAIWIERFCEERKPRAILELGSGMSTVALAIYAARHGARFVSLEHDKAWLDAIAEKLNRMGLRGHVDLIHAPLVKTSEGPWYGNDLGGFPVFDLALVDGPPNDAGGRGAVMNAIRHRLAPGAAVLVHDALRDEERAQIEKWRLHASAHTVLKEIRTAEDPRGLGVLVLP